MAVAFDAVGPSSAGTSSSSSTTLSWTHTGSGSALLVGVSVDATADGGLTTTCTCDAVAMTSLGRVESGTGGQGYVQVFGAAGLGGASHALVVTTAGGTPNDMEGGSLSFTGADTTVGGAFATAVTGSGTSITASAATAGSTSGNMCAGFTAVGDPIVSTTSPSTSRFVNNLQGGSGFKTGNAAGATSPSTGSAVTMAWGLTSSGDPWAVSIIEVLVPGSGGGAGTPTVPYSFPQMRTELVPGGSGGRIIQR